MTARIMHLVIVTSGSRGDVQPYLALAMRAAAAGHRVTLATHELFRPWVESNGIGFRALHGDPVQMLSGPGARAWLASGSRRGLWRFVREFGRDFAGLVDGMLADLATVTADADVVLYSAVCMAVAQLHELRGTPVIAGWLQPLTTTSAFPAAGLTYRDADSAWARRRNRVTHVVTEQMLWQPSRSAVNRWRRHTFNAPSLPLLGPFAAQRTPGFPVCYAYSAHVLPTPVDWSPWVRPTGWWFLNDANFTPSAALQRFMQAGDAPVSIGFGSMTPQDAEWLTRVVLDASEQAECRALLLRGWGALGNTIGETALPAWAHCETEVPHAWLYARSSALVHHGGAGTTGAAARSGVPSLTVPLGFDQQFWGSRMHAIGVAPAPIKRRDLTVEKLAAALRLMRSDTHMRETAATLGDSVRAEDGTAVALARIEAHVNR
jgi:sterol 3beta-glucosyltransferase